MIFVVGGKHSGTTLTATILGANSKCWLVPMESGSYSRQHIQQLRKPFIEKVSTIDSEFVVEKTPDHVFEIDKIQEDWPDAPIFVVTRNPIDRVASTYVRHGNFGQSIYECSEDMSGCISAMRYPNTHLVEYEKIVKHFNETVRNMCKFAGLRFEQSMVDFHENSPTWYEKQLFDEHHKIRSNQMKMPLFDDSGKGKRILSSRQIEQVLFDCADKYKILTGKILTKDGS
jgi:hypothetical protein